MVYRLLLLVDDYVLLHELVESLHVHLGVDGRDPILLTIVEPHLDPVLTLLLDIVLLQVIDDSDVINELSILGDILVSIAQTFLLKVCCQFTYKNC